MKKKYLLLFTTLGIAIAGLGVCLGSEVLLPKIKANNTSFELEINKPLSIISNKCSVLTTRGSKIEFETNGTSTSNVIDLTSSQYLKNTTKICDINSIIITFTGSLSISYGNNLVNQNNAIFETINSNQEFSLLGSSNYFAIKASNNVSISSIKICYSCEDIALSNNLVFNDGFEDGNANEWESNNNCTFNVASSYAYSGNYGLKSTLNASCTQNRIERVFDTSNANSIFKPDTEYTISFMAKASGNAPIEGWLYFNHGTSGRTEIMSISSSYTSLSSSWKEVSLKFSYQIISGNLFVTYTRPHGAGETNKDCGAINGNYIKSIDTFFYSNNVSEIYMDDFKITSKSINTSNRIDLVHSTFNDGKVDGWQSDSETFRNYIHGTSNRIGRDYGEAVYRELNSYKASASTSNKNRVEYYYDNSDGIDGLNVDEWAYLDVTCRGSSSNINMYASIHYNGNTKDILLVNDSKSVMDVSHKTFSSQFKVNFIDNKIAITFKRPDMDNPVTEYGSIVVNNPHIDKIQLIITTTGSELDIKEVSLYKIATTPINEKSYDVKNRINDVLNDKSIKSVDVDECFRLYNLLPIDLRYEVTNIHELEDLARELHLKDGLYSASFNSSNIVKRYGVVSDIHGSDNITPGLQYLSSKGIETLLISGDICDGVEYYGTGTTEINKVKTQVLNGIGLNTNIVMSLGNHDSNNESHVVDFYDTLSSYFYSGCLDSSNARNHGNYISYISGQFFISLESYYVNGSTMIETLTDNAIEYLKYALQYITHSPLYNGGYIFLLNHLVPANTVSDSSAATIYNDILHDYPQVFCIGGHNHTTIYDPLNIMQTRYTVYNPGSMNFACFDSASDDTYIERSTPGDMTYVYYANPAYYSTSLPVGSIFEFDNLGNIRITRYDLRTEKQIDNPYILSAPKANRLHLLSYPEERKLLNTAPTWDDPKLQVSAELQGSGEYRIYLFHSTASDYDGFIYNYQYDFYIGDSLICTKKSLSEFFHSSSGSSSDLGSSRSIYIDGFTTKPTKVVVRAIDCYNASTKTFEYPIS